MQSIASAAKLDCAHFHYESISKEKQNQLVPSAHMPPGRAHAHTYACIHINYMQTLNMHARIGTTQVRATRATVLLHLSKWSAKLAVGRTQRANSSSHLALIDTAFVRRRLSAPVF